MDKESIKQEFIRRVTSLPELNRQIDKSGFVKMQAIAESLKGTPAFAQKLTAILNQLLEEKGILFSSAEEKSEWVSYLKSTNAEFIRKYMSQ